MEEPVPQRSVVFVPNKSAELADQRRRRRERFLMVAVAFLLVGSTALTVYLSGPSTLVSLASNILVFGLLFLNILLILLLLFLVVRNLVKLLFERRRGIFGARLRTKFVMAFVGFSVIPAGVLFAVAVSYIGKSTELWLNYQIEQSLGMSKELADFFKRQKALEAVSSARNVARSLAAKEEFLSEPSLLRAHLEEKRKDLQVDLLVVYGSDFLPLAKVLSPELEADQRFVAVRVRLPRGKIMRGEEWSGTRSSKSGELMEGIVPLYGGYDPKDVIGAVAVGVLVPRSLEEPLEVISQTYEQYKELISRKGLIEANYYVLLTVVLLVIIFLSTWFGFYLAKQITIPLQALAEKTKEASLGRLDFRLEETSRDEVGILVESFNEMAQRLRKSHHALETSRQQLEKARQESEEGRRYMEIILGNIGSAVISLDPKYRVVMVNKAAERTIGVSLEEVVGRSLEEVIPAQLLSVVRGLVEELVRGSFEAVHTETLLTLDNGQVPFRVLVGGLKDESGQTLGTVVVMDDLTDVVKAQRVLAWKEVARRMAHEIKNPLTPIKLSAQRLRKRHSELLLAEGSVMEECTRTIIEQVDHLQEMVNEFQKFARMPEPKRSPEDLNQVVRDVVRLYGESHPHVAVDVELDPELPMVPLDREQMQRVLINLLNNALAVLPAQGGKIQIRTAFNRGLRVIRAEVADNGPGIPPAHKARLFEPYFSTKEGGMGLGLTIARSIVAEHGGYIRVLDNEPQGTRFVIELPL